MKWELSDGTVVHLGGKVDGGSLVAGFLRRTLADAKDGDGPLYYPDPLPCEGIPLDVDDARHVNAWVQDVARCKRVDIISHPEIEPLTGSPAPADDSRGPILH